MKRWLISMSAVVLFAIPASAQDKNSDKAQIVGTAEITKVDAKKQMLTVRNIQSAATGGNPSNNGNTRRQGGGGGGGVGGVGFPGGGGGRRRGGYPGGNTGGSRSGSQSGQPKEYKVYVSKDTVIKLANADLTFTDLHVGDRIAVAGTPKNGSGGDLDATTITRDPPQ
ncbi:MAG TPA: hypothetical protein VGK48_17085 [Terriglobia bacterium]|jgi:hypothetical protein